MNKNNKLIEEFDTEHNIEIQNKKKRGTLHIPFTKFNISILKLIISTFLILLQLFVLLVLFIMIWAVNRYQNDYKVMEMFTKYLTSYGLSSGQIYSYEQASPTFTFVEAIKLYNQFGIYWIGITVFVTIINILYFVGLPFKLKRKELKK